MGTAEVAAHVEMLPNGSALLTYHDGREELVSGEDLKGRNGEWAFAAASKITPSNRLMFPDSNGTPVVVLDFDTDTPRVWVHPDRAWDVAAKLFWNNVYRLVGRVAPFPDID